MLLTGIPGATEVKGSALMFSTYLVRKSIVKACSFAFRSQTWLVRMAERQAVKQMPNRPNATEASTNVKAAMPLALRLRVWPGPVCDGGLFSRLIEAIPVPRKKTNLFHA